MIKKITVLPQINMPDEDLVQNVKVLFPACAVKKQHKMNVDMSEIPPFTCEDMLYAPSIIKEKKAPEPEEILQK